MCLLVVSYRTDPGAPIMVAANREERYDRPAEPAALRDGPPRVLCGIDLEAGGTWLGVNERGLLVAVTNRPGSDRPDGARSRGLLCRDLLACAGAEDAAALAARELASGRYAGANFVCLDAGRGAVVEGRRDPRPVEPGLHVMTNGDLDDPDDPRVALARRLVEAARRHPPAAFARVAAAVCGHPDLVVRADGRGTVSSELMVLTALPADAVYLHAPGAPDRTAYLDRSELLRTLLAANPSAVG